MARVWIKSLPYETGDRPIEPYSPATSGVSIRVQGEQQRKDSTLAPVFRYGWHQGVGWSRMDRETGRGMNGLRDSTAETRFHIVEAALLHESQTHAQPADAIVAYVHAYGDFWGIFNERRNGDGAGNSPTDLVVCRKFTSSSDEWGSGGTVQTAANVNTNASDPIRAFDAFFHKGDIYVLFCHDVHGTSADTVYQIHKSPDGFASTSTDVGGTNWPDGSSNNYVLNAIGSRRNFDDDYARGMDFGNKAIVALYEDPDTSDGSTSQVLVYYTSNKGTAWTAGAVIPSDSGPKALVRWLDPFSSPPTDSPVLITAEGVYRVDSGGTTFDLIYALDGDPNNGRRSVVGLDGSLYVGLGSGQISKLTALPSGGLKVTNAGPPGDGLVSARQGHVNYMLAIPERWLIVAYGGHAADKNAGVWAIEYQVQTDLESGAEYQVWHHLYKESDDNIDITALGFSTEDDATPRLHFALEGASTFEMYHLEDPLVSGAATGVTQKKQSPAVSYIEFPQDSLGNPSKEGAVFAASVEADDLSGTASSSDEYIEVEYGLDGAVSTTVSNFGNFISSDKELQFGRSNQNIDGQTESGTPVGVAATSITSRLIFNRGSTNTNGAKLLDFALEARYKANQLNGFVIPIDMGLSARAQNATVETVESRLKTVRESQVLVPVKFDSFAYGELYMEEDLSPGTLDLLQRNATRTAGRIVGGIKQLAMREVR